MESVSENEKSTLKQKFYEFQLAGLVSYGKYLSREYDNSNEAAHKKAYTSYIKQEMERNALKIEEVEQKIG